MKTFNGCPVFLANVDGDDCTITAISLVDFPAMELKMVCFEKEEKMSKYMFSDEMQHNIVSCIVRTDFPILRLDETGNPYYMVFDRKTSEILAQRLMKDGYQQNISLDHNGQLIKGIQLQEVFIKDSSRGISPAGFEEAAEGSLFGVYHITDEALWEDCISGKFQGVSLESYIRLETFKKIKKIDNNKNNTSMSKIKEALKKLLMEFNNISTDKAELYWEEDSELMVGYKVFVEDENGEKVPAADGEYISDENRIKVEGGVVTEITSKEEAPEAPETEEVAEPEKEENLEETPEAPATEEVGENTETPEAPEDEKVTELENRIADLEAKVAELETKIIEIAQAPAAEPVMDEFEKVTKLKNTGNKALDKRLALAKALRDSN